MRCPLFVVLALFAAAPISATRAAEAPPAETLPPDLGSRAAGIDWPDFLGPQRNARSPETGLPTQWEGVTPRIVWQCELGESYGAPSISRGRLFHFDRHEGVHRLTCRNSETGAEFWKYEPRRTTPTCSATTTDLAAPPLSTASASTSSRRKGACTA